MTEVPSGPALRVDYFDGRSPQARAAWARIESDHLLLLDEDQKVLRREALSRIQWPERQRHGQRMANLPDRGVISANDALAWDDWARSVSPGESTLVRWMQSWRLALLALVLLLVLLATGWQWGLPWVAQELAERLPSRLTDSIGSATLQALDRSGLQPSTLPTSQRARIQSQWQAAQVRLGQADATLSPSMPNKLEFRRAARSGFGANALALPNGQIIVTDELVELLADREDVLLGILGHEFGHVHHRHGLRMALQAGMVTSIAALVLGDFSSLLAGFPALLSQSAYSRDMEREADEFAVRVMDLNDIDPSVMTVLFERLDASRKHSDDQAQSGWLIAFSSHPADEERVQFFRSASRGR